MIFDVIMNFRFWFIDAIFTSFWCYFWFFTFFSWFVDGILTSFWCCALMSFWCYSDVILIRFLCIFDVKMMLFLCYFDSVFHPCSSLRKPLTFSLLLLGSTLIGWLRCVFILPFKKKFSTYPFIRKNTFPNTFFSER